MRRVLTLVLVLFLAPAPLRAEDESRPKPPPRLTTQQAAEQAKAAAERKDSEALALLARRQAPDPWRVLEYLLIVEQADTALALAKAAPDTHAEQMASYVSRLRDKPLDQTVSAAFKPILTHLAKREWPALLKAASEVDLSADRVTTLRLLYAVGRAQLASRKIPDAHRSFTRVASVSESMGWLSYARGAHDRAAQAAFAMQAWKDALASWRTVLRLADQLGQRANAAVAITSMGGVYLKLGQTDEALASMQEGLRRMEEIGDKRRVAAILTYIGSAHSSRGALKEAKEAYQQALVAAREFGDRKGEALMLGNLGSLEARLGDLENALAIQHTALKIHEEIGDEEGVADTLGNIANMHTRLGNYSEAIKTHKVALASKQNLGDREGSAITLGNLANVYLQIGNVSKSLSTLKRTLTLKQAIGVPRSTAFTLSNIGNVYARMGNPAEALAYHERAVALRRQVKDTIGIEESLLSLASTHRALGQGTKALSLATESLELARSGGHRAAIALALLEIGAAHQGLGDLDEALETLQEARDLNEELGNRPAVAGVMASIGNVQFMRRDYKAALATQQAVLALNEELGAKALTVASLGRIGALHRKLGNLPEALKFHEKAVRDARRLRLNAALAEQLGHLARLRLEMGDPARALETARQAMPYLEKSLGGLDEEAGATARTLHARLYGAGALAAARLEEPEEVLSFLENGRAGALLEGLDGREAMSWVAVPESLRAEEVEAQAAYSQARHNYAKALASGKLRKTRAASAALDKSLELVRGVAARIQRHAKREAEIFYPRVATLDEVQAALSANDAMVLYGLCLGQGLALVITQDDARVVLLAEATELDAACGALDTKDIDVDPSKAYARLTTLLVKPLQLPKTIDRVLLSPEGPLSYVPFGVLFSSRDVALTASGTTHVFLSDNTPPQGEGVLALGDPQYGRKVDPGAAAAHRGGALSPLPATRAEAKAVGDVLLLGAEAGESSLKKALAKRPRWRALHLACHGLVDPERPTSSALALTRQGEDDGFFTCAEVLRSRIPADLAVLSACETGTGKIVFGEGIVGFTRAFMFAGAPRVICSLWKVDDAATQALMIKFYELWNPKDGAEGLSAAAALRQAQAFVRAHPKHPEWKHPYYWAAWVLWGLAD